MSQYVKPQSPIRIEDTYIYPLTTADQVMLENGERLNSKIYDCVGLDTEDGIIGEPNPVNADTLGGISADNFASKTFVQNKIAEAQLSGSDGNVDLSGYATNDHVNQQVRKAAPRNLLDNSDFRNPVNQRGNTVYSNGYSIDRWIAMNNLSQVTVTNNGIAFCKNTTSEGSAYFNQIIADSVVVDGGHYTIAACIDGNIYLQSGVVNGVDTNIHVDTPKGTVSLMYSSAYQSIVARFTTSDTTESVIVWMALYEGEYTADTLPEYQPKGYGAEYLECCRYYWCKNTFYYTGRMYSSGQAFAGQITVPVPMRVTPTVSLDTVSLLGGGLYTENPFEPTEVTIRSYDTFTNAFTLYLKVSQQSGMNLHTVTCTITNLELNADL